MSFLVGNPPKSVIGDQEEHEINEKDARDNELLEWGKDKASANTHVEDIKRVLSSSANQNGREINNVEVKEYQISSTHTRLGKGSLVDCGANGGIAGDDVRVISWTDRKVDVTGMGDHTVSGLSLVTAGAVAESTAGEVLVVLNQYAHAPRGTTIHY